MNIAADSYVRLCYPGQRSRKTCLTNRDHVTCATVKSPDASGIIIKPFVHEHVYLKPLNLEDKYTAIVVHPSAPRKGRLGTFIDRPIKLF